MGDYIDAFEFMNYLRDTYNVTFREAINYYLER